MVSTSTRNRWSKEGVKPPSAVVAIGWKCPVCEAGRMDLQFISEKTPEAIACFRCSLPFSMPHTNKAPPYGCRPLPAVSDDWVTAWKLAYADKAFNKTCRLPGGRGFAQLLMAFPSAQDAIDFFETDEEEESR